MSYRMHELSDQVRAGITSRGDLHIEVHSTHPNGQRNGEPPEEILVPWAAVDALFGLLRRA